MELRRANNVHDEEESMHLDQDLEVVEVDSKRRNGRNDKRKLKNQIFPFRMTMRNGLECGIMLQAKGELSS